MEKDFTSHTTNINPKRFPNFPVNCPHFWCYIYNIVSQYLSLSLSLLLTFISSFTTFLWYPGPCEASRTPTISGSPAPPFARSA